VKVSEVMTGAAISDRPDDTLAQAAAKMWGQQTGSLLVMEGGQLLGIVTERDVLRAVAEGRSVEETRVSEVMTKDVVTVHPAASLREAASIMTDRWIRHLPVVERGTVVGIVSQRDLAGVLGSALNEPEALTQLVEASELARERRLRRIEDRRHWD
jgi:CBS domain-containing protein